MRAKASSGGPKRSDPLTNPKPHARCMIASTRATPAPSRAPASDATRALLAPSAQAYAATPSRASDRSGRGSSTDPATDPASASGNSWRASRLLGWREAVLARKVP
jgi:hypothetical protein